LEDDRDGHIRQNGEHEDLDAFHRWFRFVWFVMDTRQSQATTQGERTW
jgi:hypothetical protein